MMRAPVSPVPCLAIVVPCYNEEEVFSDSQSELAALLSRMVKDEVILPQSYILFVDDGSNDRTWQMIERAVAGSSLVRGVKLSRNVGHQSALLAGLEYGGRDADVIVSIDADLQDDVSAIPKMVAAYRQGYDVVYGVRSSRRTDSWFKRTTAEGFYRFMGWMGVKQVFNHADFRLLSHRALKGLQEYRESNAYLRGLVPMVGFPSTEVHYARGARQAGESKYPLKKMLSLALDGITSMTISPLRIISWSGFFISIISIIAAFYVLILKVIGQTIVGWSSTMLAIFFMGGIQMLSLGVIGEYVGKIYLEAKKRPSYHVEKTLAERNGHLCKASSQNRREEAGQE